MNPPGSLRIGDLIEVPPVQTVIRLTDGRTESKAITGSFVFTSEVVAHFHVLCESLLRSTGQGFFLQGDFGSGKSHFLAALAAWFEELPGSETLASGHPGLQRLRETNRRLLPVAVSLVQFRASTPLERIIIAAIEEALAQRGARAPLTPLGRFWQQFQEILGEPSLRDDFARENQLPPDSLDSWFHDNARKAYGTCLKFLKSHGLPTPEVLVEERHETFARAIEAVQAAGFAGAVLLLDELSEFLRAKPDPAALNEDARTLQFLGEATAGAPFWIIAAVQESVERTGDIAQPTLRKIKDRFPIRLSLSTVHIRDLLSRRLVKRKPGADEVIHQIYESYRRHFPTFTCDYDHFRRIYPVHPATLALLEGLSDLFSEHRGIVDFVHSRLAGDPRRRITGILDRPSTELLAPDSIYEHFAGRLAEFSAFNIYPRHIIPHLDEVIERVLKDAADRVLARRLIRILALYSIHPAAPSLTVRSLAELAACMLASQDPDLNAQFVGEALLDPVVEASRFLVKKAAPTADPLDASYAMVKEDDSAKTLKARVTRIAGELSADDSRLLTEPLAEIAESIAWPGPELCKGPVYRHLTWRHSPRCALVAFAQPRTETALRGQISAALNAMSADFAVVFSLEKMEVHADHTAVWRMPFPKQDLDVLREYCAAKMVATELRPSSPADAPLIAMTKDAIKRLEAAAHQAALHAVFAGEFLPASIFLEPAVRQLRRFDRLLETAGEFLLESRYPKFKEIAPRGVPASPRLYQRLLDEFAAPGALSLRDARGRGLTDSIESLAVPLGLVTLKSGSYLLSPDPAEHPFLLYVFNLLSASGPLPLADFLHRLRTGPYGVSKDAAAFLLASLAHGGLISLLSRGRTLPVEVLRFTSIETADAIAPGELINKADRDTLLNSCAFLAPQQGWSTFGLRQQRDAWQAIVRFKESTQGMIQDIQRGSASTTEYSAFESFDVAALQAKLDVLRGVSDEIKISYTPREGVERFCQAWRGSGLDSETVALLQQLRRFFLRFAEQFVFLNHYIRHRSVERAIAGDHDLAALRQTILSFFSQPELMVVRDDGAQLNLAFGRFRESYLERYRQHHAAFYKASQPRDLDKFARRAMGVLRRLTEIEFLDRPPGLEKLLRNLETPARPPCARNLAEELLRSPTCGCGFQIGDEPARAETTDAGALIESGLRDYLVILQNSQVLEPMAARAYALRDMDAKVSERLRQLGELLKNSGEKKPAALLDLLDDQTLGELGRALMGKAAMETRRLAELTGRLSGRRLTRQKILQLIEDWLGKTAEDAILSLEEDAASDAAPPREGFSVAWWPLLRTDVFDRGFSPLIRGEDALRAMQNALEQAFPVAQLQPRLARLTDDRLARFLAEETCHTRAAQCAWISLVERMIQDPSLPRAIPSASSHLSATEAAQIGGRLEALRRLQAFGQAPFPERLQARLAANEVWHDSWATRELQAAIESFTERTAAAGKDWLDALPPCRPLALDDHPLVLIVDGAPPDVWLRVCASLPTVLPTARLTWLRLDVKPQTVPSFNLIFGFEKDRDPMSEFAARGIVYHDLEGAEAGSIADLVSPMKKGTAVVMRLAVLDRDAHRAVVRLCDLPGKLQNVLERQLPEMLAVCSRQKRRLVLTSDHGLSWTRQGLSHGRGGVYEQAIPRLEWPA